MTNLQGVYSDGERLIVDTRLANSNLVNDGARPFAVCRYLFGSKHRITCLDRYETLAKAKSALRYLRPNA